MQDIFDSRYGAVFKVRGGPAGKAVLKLSPPNEEATREAAGLAAYQGAAVPSLYERDDSLGALLFEEIRSGQPLAAAELDDRKQTKIIAQVLTSLWAVPTSRLPAGSGLDDYIGTRPHVMRARWNSEQDLMPRSLLEQALEVFETWQPTTDPVILHNDLHHQNILLSQSDWVAIDPKCLRGPREADLAPMLRNPWMQTRDVGQLRKRQQVRLSLMHEMTGTDTERARRYALANTVDLALWSFSAGEKADAEYLTAVAQSLS
ncbi:aminoglycoside phosphotransferase family protein [Streptomyces sp. NPDC006552]|uniref:aminoglycoside phosphotransferase family protein n=1 Tax=Streptomyces sp. NPDC006552 TaxID=3157179 RepID=UPI0033ACBC5B